MFRRHPVLSILLILGLAATAALAIFVATFDLNLYRQRLQTSLSEALSQPVTLGEAKLSLRHGPALDFSDIRIGKGEGEGNVLRAKSLALRPALRPLLRGEVIFDHIVLDSPHYSQILAPSQGDENNGESSPFLLDQGMTEKLLIHSLTIHNGSIHFIDRRNPREPRTLTLEDLEIQGDDLSLNRPSGVRLQGRLVQSDSSTPFSLEGGIIPGPPPRRWQATELNLTLTLGEISPEALLKQVLPGAASQGTLSLKLGMQGTAAEGFALTADIRGKTLALQFSDPPSSPIPLQSLSLQTTWKIDGDRQRFTAINLETPGLKAQGDLTLQSPGSRPRMDLKMTASLESETLLSRLSPYLPADLRVQGTVPLSMALRGTGEELTAELYADLTPLNLELDRSPGKPAGNPGHLALSLTLTPSQLKVTTGELAISPLTIRARGEMERDSERNFRFALDVPPLDVAPLAEHFPPLKKLQLQGRIGLAGEFSGSRTKPLERQGKVSLEEVGLHLGKVVADLSNINGTIAVKNDRAQFKGIKANLGSSPIRVSGGIEDLTSPQLQLKVLAKSIRADEVVFLSDKAFLRDVDGRLRISADGISFEPVTVRLDGGTRARVTGRVNGFKNPKVDLHVAADYGNIDEVIALWHGDSAPPPPADKAAGRGTEITITVSAREGLLSGLHFQDAEGTISIHPGRLIIHPLHFRSGPGYCVGAVVSESRPDQPPLLKISGHIEDFDAAAVYSDLLRQRGLIIGTLRGDFYTEGTAGEEYLPSSLGAFNIEVRDGVLRKFNSLAKIFSILNVSQIFAFQLPDMSSKGMPFSTLKGNVLLQKGVLSTEDLFVDGNAMNLSAIGSLDLQTDDIDLVLGVKPLRTVDKIITKIPIAGWLLTGEEKALITAHFRIHGKSADPSVFPIPITSVSEKVIGIFKRVFGLPGKIISDVGGVIEGGGSK